MHLYTPPGEVWGALSSNPKLSKADALRGKHFAMYFPEVVRHRGLHLALVWES